MKWTKEQQNVIDFRNRNILVSAAAGSGKTAVLVERIIKRITDPNNPTDIDKLLVVTFTKAAAGEMRERIGNAIEKKLEEFPEDENLRKQQTLIHNAQITTIDSFCLFVVRNYFEEIDLDPNFRIADSGEIKLMELDVLNSLFESEYQKKRPSFLKLVDTYSNKRGNKNVKDMVTKIYHQSASNPWPKEWICGLSEPYKVQTVDELRNTQIMQGIYQYVKNLLLEIPSRIEALKKIAEEPLGPNGYVKNLEEDLLLFQDVDSLSSYEDIHNFLRTVKFKNLSAIRNFEGDVNKKEAVADGRKAIKEEIEKYKKRYFSMPLDDILMQLRNMEDVAEELVHLSLLYLEAMERRKLEKHIMDFSDIEHAALRIFKDEHSKEVRVVAKAFQKQFDEIMIDEYQDSNQVQEEIMRAISREEDGQYNMFMVGDVKQSIYRFRLARPELFMEKFASYDLCESKKQRIDLHKNFRSRPEVLDFTNDIFYKIMHMDLGNVAYDDAAALYCGAEYKPSCGMEAEVLLYEKKAEDENALGLKEDDIALSNRQLEAKMVAAKIKELKESLKVTDKKTAELRPLQNRDIVILFRSLKDWGNEFSAVLSECGIPSHVATSTGYFSALEVQTVLSFLKIIDNPYQDIPMAAVLNSPIVGLDNEELAEISLKNKTDCFSQKVLTLMEEAEEGKLFEFNKLYQKLRKKVMDTAVHDFIELVLEESGYGDYVKALPSGLQRSANLNMLLEKAICYEKTSYKGLFHFIRYIDQLQKYEVDFGEADVAGENEDVVRIMTIHKSKGLEFPVVFVSGIAKKFNESDAKDTVAIHPDLGLGLDEVTLMPKTKKRCLIRSEIIDRVRRDNLGEELRVLYVALTRAKEKLILTGMVSNQETLYKTYTGNVIPKVPLSLGQRNNAKSYLDWIVPAILSYPSKYEMQFISEKDLILDQVKEEVDRSLEKEALIDKIRNADSAMVEHLKECFHYEYPYLGESTKKSKYSVSELKHASMVQNYDKQEDGLEIPSFLETEKDSYIPRFISISEDKKSVDIQEENRGALRGTAVHRVMECFDFAGLLSIQLSSKEEMMEYLESELESMLEKKRITQEMIALVSREKLYEFLRSPEAFQMAKAQNRGDLFREKPFVMDYEGSLLQGIIDVFWLEDDYIFLLDYKTDRVKDAEELIQRYETQLDLYSQALERVFSTDTKTIKGMKKLIYSFGLNQTIYLG